MACTVSDEVVAGSSTTASVLWLIVSTASRTAATTTLVSVLQEAFKVFEFLEFGIWERVLTKGSKRAIIISSS